MNKNVEQNRIEIIYEIIMKPIYSNGISTIDLKKEIKNHKEWNKYFASASKNSNKQWWNSTRRLLQNASINMKNYSGKTPTLFWLKNGMYTYYHNPIAIKEDKETKTDDANKLEEGLSKIGDEQEKESIVKTRINQGKFRKWLIEEFKDGSPVKNIKNHNFLIASHIVDYKDCEKEWKADPRNGILLEPDIDKLFDLKEITFSDETGQLIYIKDSTDDYKKMGAFSTFKLNPKFMTELRIKYLKERNKKILMKD